ncbi:MAG: glycoside hydrolase family 2 sugar binding protein [Patescibacteria group bacterium]|nr:glycoside hydrolase family 2 sugar binding protein [Patescibacteria group bacterium]
MENITIPRPEYPRPQFVRDRWTNLNGEWEFTYDDEDKGLTEGWFDGRSFDRKITVPFAYQTKLSGINEQDIHEIVWYARTFEAPAEWAQDDLLLHFGAIDYRSTVWVNGKEVGHNQGGHISFSFDIAPYLVTGENRIVVRVEDRQDPHQPRGKQSVNGKPAEIDYFCTTGIWQTVWLEPVPQMRIDDLKITPSAITNSFDIAVFLHAPSIEWEIEVVLSSKGQEVVRLRKKTTFATAHLRLGVAEPEYWTPENPHLYDLTVRFFEGDKLLDEVKSYAGLRTVHVEKGKVMLNNVPTYMAMVLDQGYWPQGGMTAPTDDDLRADVEWTKKFGFNGSRKHQKMEDPRWLYWCDKLGLMVWGEMANARAWSPKAEEWLAAEWERAVRRDYNHPCIVAWVPMNESWGVPDLKENHPGQYAFIERLVALTRRFDPYRPVIDNDGWEHSDTTDICAIHDYAANGEELRRGYLEMLEHGKLRDVVWANGIRTFARGAKYRGQPIILSEIGGLLMVPQDIPEAERDVLYQHYGSINSVEELMDRYRDLMEGVLSLTFLAGFCYTQLIDVEQEINGLMTYDRKPKVDPALLTEIHKKIIASFK